MGAYKQLLHPNSQLSKNLSSGNWLLDYYIDKFSINYPEIVEFLNSLKNQPNKNIPLLNLIHILKSNDQTLFLTLLKNATY